MSTGTASPSMVRKGAQHCDCSTPTALFAILDAEFHFTIDVCASEANAKCPVFYDATDNGLDQRWRGVCWMNPPYGREIGKWMRKARESAIAGATVVCLIPCRTDASWWHECVSGAAEIRFIRGRITFGEGPYRAPFPSCVVIFRPTPPDRPVVKFCPYAGTKLVEKFLIELPMKDGAP